MRAAWAGALAAAAVLACGGESGTLVTATLPDDIAAELGVGPLALEWFVAPLDDGSATDAMRRSLYDGDSYDVEVQALRAGQTLRLSPERSGRAQVAVVVWAPDDEAGGDARQLVAFATTPVTVGDDALRAYSLTLARAWDSELGTAPQACLDLGAAATDRPRDPERVAVHVYGRADAPAVPTYGSCLRWWDGDAVRAMVWPDDRDCDGAAVGQTLAEVCAIDPLQCDPTELGDGASGYDPRLLEDPDGDGFTVGLGDGGPKGLDLGACAPCELDGVEVPCDCPLSPGADAIPADVHVGADEVCDGTDSNCDGLADAVEPASLCLAGANRTCEAARVGCEGVGDGQCGAFAAAAASTCPDAVCRTQRVCEFTDAELGDTVCFVEPAQLCDPFVLPLSLNAGPCRVRLFGGGADATLALLAPDGLHPNGDAHTVSTANCNTVSLQVDHVVANEFFRRFIVEVELVDAPGIFKYLPMTVAWRPAEAGGDCGQVDPAECAVQLQIN